MNDHSQNTNPAARLETLIQALESSHDSSAAIAREFASALLDFHKTGITRLLQIVRSEASVGSNLLAQLTADQVVQSLLLIHDLHPVDVESRVRQAIAQLAPLLEAQAFSVTIVAVSSDRVRLQLNGSGANDQASFQLLEQTLQAALLEAAPDVREVQILPGDNAVNPRFELPLVRFTETPSIRQLSPTPAARQSTSP
jgi:hypothetical protein